MHINKGLEITPISRSRRGRDRCQFHIPGLRATVDFIVLFTEFATNEKNVFTIL